MLKIEYVWRELLFQAIDCQNPIFSITGLSQKFALSTSVVTHALKPLREMRMVEVGKLRSRVIDVERILMFWATRRNIKRDIYYQTESDLSVWEREASMPLAVKPTAYSAYTQMFEGAPADYDVIYYYAYDLAEVVKRFPAKETKHPNLIILKPDNFLNDYPHLPTAQLFVDLWNVNEWYARDFTNALLVKIKEKIGL